MKHYFLLGCVVAVVPIVQLVSAKAADLGPAIAPSVPYVVPTFNWTGFYIGPNIGAGWENFNITDTLTGLSFGSNTRSAFIGGGQVGFNYQVSPFFVLGAEGFFDGIASNNNTGIGVVIPRVGLVTTSVQPDWVSTVAGRIGFTGPGFDHWLFYAKGGGGWIQASPTINTARQPSANPEPLVAGWLAGASNGRLLPTGPPELTTNLLGWKTRRWLLASWLTRSLLGTPTFKL
jgi:outer membrane immunogenic protein